MTPTEFHWEAELRRGPKMYGKMNEYEVAEIYHERPFKRKKRNIKRAREMLQ